MARGRTTPSLVLYFVATYHAIAAGTDKQNQVFRIAALASINIVMFLTVVLILAARKAKLGARSVRLGDVGRRRTAWTAEPTGRRGRVAGSAVCG